MEWLTNLIGFLDKHSGGMIVIFTAIYVFGTLLMWLEMRRTRLNIDEPRVQISLIPRRERWLRLIDLLIENVGNVPIVDLKLIFVPTDLKNIHGREFKEIFKEPIKTLGKDRSIKILMFRGGEWGTTKEIKITAEYASLYNQKIKKITDFIFSMDNFKISNDAPYEYDNSDFITELREIGGSIKSLKFPLDEIESIKKREEFEKNRFKLPE